jgi:hypothetical protein
VLRSRDARRKRTASPSAFYIGTEGCGMAIVLVSVSSARAACGNEVNDSS